ncbi:MAG: protein YgfX [Rhodanobacter sp.]|jgi:toxin CptA|uniref:protein YgfX n=1 Tax=Rhodanobacter sp. KK11 TaxID=3083255 RepID=UPI0029662D35|nr:protein YgfX [Rhodanobacter sp. KK11]MDW2982519.1 protein YgfX [Rhodanobacter sp. KK11]
MTSAPAIGFEYRPSRLLRRTLLLVTALAVLAVALSALAAWLKLLLAIAVSLATWHALRRLAAGPVAAAGWSADGAWTLRLTDHQDMPATLASFRVLGALVLLRLRTAEQGMQVLLLAPDNSDADIRRRLRMRLATIQPGEALPRP